jgi:predicted nucleic acid-binding protein
MNAVVIDASAALSLVFPDDDSEKVHAFFSTLAPETELIVPPLWWYECTNVLLTVVKRKRLEASEAREALAALWELPVRTDASPLIHGWIEGGAHRDANAPPTPVSSTFIFHVGLTRDLSAYDSAYLCLAELHGAALLSLDDGVRAVARDLGITVAELG